MKKIIFSLGTLLMLLAMVACSGGVGKIESLTKDVEKNSEEWDTEKWENVLKEAYDTAIEFLDKSDIKEKDFEKMTDAMEDFFEACRDSDSSKKYFKARGKKSIENLSEKYNKKVRKLNDKFNDE